MVETLILIVCICLLILFIFMFKEKEQTRRTLNALQWKMDMIQVIAQRLEDQSKKLDEVLQFIPKPPTQQEVKEAQVFQQQQAQKLQKIIDEYLG